MSVVEAFLWALGSLVLLQSLWHQVEGRAPHLKGDPGVSSLCQIVAYLVLLLLIRTFYFPKSSARVVFAMRPASWAFYPIAAVLGVAILFPASAIYEAMLARWPDTAQGDSILATFATMPLWRKVAAGFGLCVATPLAEEVLFRGALFGTLRRRHHPAVVVISTAVLFAFVHVQPQLMLPIGIVGAALAFLRVASGSIWPGVVMHMAFNGLSFYAQLTQSDPDAPTPRWQVVAGVVVTAGMLAIAEHLRAKKGDAEPGARQEDEA